jgi:predicted transcriptional regulator
MLKPKTVIAVFEATWKLEPASVNQVIEKSGLSGVTVRCCLNTLCERGEVFKIAGDMSCHRGATPSLYMTTKTEASRKAAAYRVACQRRDAASEGAAA